MKPLNSILLGFLAYKLVRCASFGEVKEQEVGDDQGLLDISASSQVSANLPSAEVEIMNEHLDSGAPQENLEILEVKSIFPELLDLEITDDDCVKLIDLKDIKHDQNLFFITLCKKVITERIFLSDLKYKLARYLLKTYTRIGLNGRRIVDKDQRFLQDFINFLIDSDQYDMILELLPEEFKPALMKIKDDEKAIVGFLNCKRNSTLLAKYNRALQQVSQNGFSTANLVMVAILNGIPVNELPFMNYSNDIIEAVIKALMIKNFTMEKFNTIRDDVMNFMENHRALPQVKKLILARYSEKVLSKLSIILGVEIEEFEKHCRINFCSYENFHRFAGDDFKSFEELEKEFALHFLKSIHPQGFEYRNIGYLIEALKEEFEC